MMEAKFGHTVHVSSEALVKEKSTWVKDCKTSDRRTVSLFHQMADSACKARSQNRVNQ